MKNRPKIGLMHNNRQKIVKKSGKIVEKSEKKSLKNVKKNNRQKWHKNGHDFSFFLTNVFVAIF